MLKQKNSKFSFYLNSNTKVEKKKTGHVTKIGMRGTETAL